MRTARDHWLLTYLHPLLGDAGLEALRSAACDSYWDEAVRRELVTDAQILRVLAQRFRMKVADVARPSRQARDAVSEHLARKYHALPLAVSDGTLDVAVADPRDLDCEHTLAFATGRRIRLSLAAPRAIAERLDELYAPERAVERILEGLDGGHEVEAVPEDPAAAADETVFDGGSDAERPIVRLVDSILADGITRRASDIHLESGEGAIAVRYRVDGVLRHAMTLPRSVGIPLVSRIKILASLDIADRLRPQDGRARATVNGDRVDLRISTLPAAHGEKVVVRILDARATPLSLEALGMGADDARRVERLIAIREGLVLVTGPTGSGKTTTLYSMLKQIQARGVNIVTVEDPVEYRLAGVVQVQVNEKAGLTFAAALRSILRQDPDVVLIGEIRDRETAQIAVQASLTGHLVLSTLHTLDAASSIVRLSDLGVEPYKVAAALKGIVAQRLVRRLCGACAGAPEAGCETCGGSGYRGRAAVCEILVADAEVERAIGAGAPVAGVTAAARRGGMRTLWESGQALVRAGATTPGEVARVLDLPKDEIEAEAAADVVQPLGAPPILPRMTEIKAGVVDVYVVRPYRDEWLVLALQRALDTRCPTAWEAVHGRLEAGELPQDAAVREVREETGLEVDRLYSITVQPFYLQAMSTVQLAVVFAAFVREPAQVSLGPEHQAHAWLSVPDAMRRFVWPREKEALQHIVALLGAGHAGPVEDVLRVF